MITKEGKIILSDYGIKNFSVTEILKVCHPLPDRNFWFNIIPTLQILQELRTYIKQPIYLTSGYRGKEYNKQIGGRPNSLHLRFNALDFVCNFDKEEIKKFFVNRKDFNKLGFIIYNSFFHLDTRGAAFGLPPFFNDLRK